MDTSILSEEEFENLAADLEDKHALFHAFWQLGKITFSNEIQTAAVSFNEDGQTIEFMFNQQFWKSLSDYDRMFVICHECLHVALNHGFRARDSKNKELSNIAMDIVVNHTLVDSFGFIRNNITDWQNFCWVETVLPNMGVPSNETFEYYYNKLVKELSDHSAASGGFPNTVDDHSGLSTMAPQDADGDSKANGFLERVGGLLSNEERQQVSDTLKTKAEKAGTGAVNTAWCAPKSKTSIKMAWKHIFKKFKDINKHVLAETEQWARYHRRSTFLDKTLMLPSEMEDLDGQDNSKIKAWFFLDVSGSCEHLKPRFWKAAKSVPREYFDLKLFSFSTRIWEVDVKNEKVFGGGGTSFSCIERFIQKTCAEKGMKYPNVVCVITDGWGDHVKPEFADRWYWFLPERSTKVFIPKTSLSFKLKDFE